MPREKGTSPQKLLGVCLNTSVHVGMASSSSAGKLYLIGQMTLPRGIESQGSQERSPGVAVSPADLAPTRGPEGAESSTLFVKSLAKGKLP